MTPLRRYYRGTTLAGVRDVQAGTSYVPHFDHQGTTQCLTNAAGTVTDRFASDAWGVQVKRTGSSINRQWYVGNWGYYRQKDWQSDYVRARWLSPLAAAWLSRDPDPDEIYRVYARNNPAAAVDPSGLRPVKKYPCMVIGIYGRTQHVGDPPQKLGIVHKIIALLPKEFEHHEFNSEIGSDRSGHYTMKNGHLGGGDTQQPHNQITSFIHNRPEYIKGGCICIVSYSWGVGQTVLLMNDIRKNAPKLVIALLFTVDGIQVQSPGGRNWDPTFASVRAKIEGVQKHENWYGGKPYQATFLGIHINAPFGGSPIAGALSKKSHGRNHTTINDDPKIPPDAIRLIKRYCRRCVPAMR